ncbi:MAG: leucine-rich repeat domain-containing protein [Muribaculaceae bacterium]|nr:leucine-rich repeat domain-containing protein [Muribaculaceae bacterium]
MRGDIIRLLGISLSILVALNISAGNPVPLNNVDLSYSVSNDSLTVIWPGEVKELPSYEFKDNRVLRRIVLEEGVEIIGEYAFLGCENLTEIILPSTLREIREGAFRECSSLKKLEIPEGVSIIPAYMCAWDENLEEVSLPESVRDIQRNAFSYCYRLKEIDLPSLLIHIGPNAFSFCTDLKEISVPDTMEELESYAFSGCENLQRAKLPSNSKMLGELLFTGCRNITEIICMSEEPPTFDCDTPPFDPLENDLWKQCQLVVPAASEDLYKDAPGWSMFFQTELIY